MPLQMPTTANARSPQAHHQKHQRERERALDQADDDAGSDRIMVPTERERAHRGQSDRVSQSEAEDRQQRTDVKEEKEGKRAPLLKMKIRSRAASWQTAASTPGLQSQQ